MNCVIGSPRVRFIWGQQKNISGRMMCVWCSKFLVIKIRSIKETRQSTRFIILLRKCTIKFLDFLIEIRTRFADSTICFKVLKHKKTQFLFLVPVSVVRRSLNGQIWRKHSESDRLETRQQDVPGRKRPPAAAPAQPDQPRAELGLRRKWAQGSERVFHRCADMARQRQQHQPGEGTDRVRVAQTCRYLSHLNYSSYFNFFVPWSHDMV